jgi:hypothetical protein
VVIAGETDGTLRRHLKVRVACAARDRKGGDRAALQWGQTNDGVSGEGIGPFSNPLPNSGRRVTRFAYPTRSPSVLEGVGAIAVDANSTTG